MCGYTLDMTYSKTWYWLLDSDNFTKLLYYILYDLSTLREDWTSTIVFSGFDMLQMKP